LAACIRKYGLLALARRFGIVAPCYSGYRQEEARLAPGFFR
jgi:hypothetical protein